MKMANLLPRFQKGELRPHHQLRCFLGYRRRARKMGRCICPKELLPLRTSLYISHNHLEHVTDYITTSVRFYITTSVRFYKARKELRISFIDANDKNYHAL